MITKKIFQIAIFFTFLFTSLDSYADYYIEWTGATENFANGAVNQVAYIDFGDVSLWGCLEITLSGGWNYQNTTGMYTKRYQIGRNSNGGIYCQSAEVPASIGYVCLQWKLGDFQIDQNNHIKIPIYHLVTTQNQIVVHISGISAAEINKSLITLTSPTTVTNNEQRDYCFIKDQVAIGTSKVDEGFQLTVAGKISAREIKVTTDAGADFVFEKDYKLPTIEHVANYVQENKHLPDIPSANEMVKNGVSMGDMQVKLLQKVEEQTLYIIELNKQVQILKKQLEELKNK
jgi:hypothetical protein